MTADQLNNYCKLSLSARIAVALHCFERYCRAKRLRHPMIDAFLDHMWELPCITSFPAWESRRCELVKVGLGDPFPREILDLLQTAGVSEKEFRQLIEGSVEIIYTSAYGKSDDAGSLRFLDRVLQITASAGVPPPPPRLFLSSLFADCHGWGIKLSPEQRDDWRYKAYAPDSV